MNCDKRAMLLYAVTDRTWLNGRRLEDDVEAALRGGATMLQLREKDLPYEDYLAEARGIKALCAQYHVPFVIDDDVEVALACGADGIHVGQSDMAAGDVRRRVGESMLLGVSAQTVEQALAAERAGADYLGVGAAFPTSTKLDADVVSRETLTAICQAVHIPVCAIGGVSRDNLLELSGAGVDGVSVISAIFAAGDIEGACRELLALSTEMVAK